MPNCTIVASFIIVRNWSHATVICNGECHFVVNYKAGGPIFWICNIAGDLAAIISQTIQVALVANEPQHHWLQLHSRILCLLLVQLEVFLFWEFRHLVPLLTANINAWTSGRPVLSYSVVVPSFILTFAAQAVCGFTGFKHSELGVCIALWRSSINNVQPSAPGCTCLMFFLMTKKLNTILILFYLNMQMILH